VVAVPGVPERQVLVHFVAVAASFTALAQVAGPLEVADDLGSRALGDSEGLRDVPETHSRVGGNHLEHVA
jgi:hypothetical protein